MIEEHDRHRKCKDYMPTQILRTLPEATSAQLSTTPETGNTCETAIPNESPGNINIDSVPLQDATSRQQEPMSLPDATSSSQVPTIEEHPDGNRVQQEVIVPLNMNQDLEDSDTMIIYSPDDAVKNKKKRVFTTVT